MDRRRTSRFVIPEFAQGTFRVMQDVYIQAVETDGVVLLMDHGLTAGVSINATASFNSLPAVAAVRL
jgi:hypothetical protein